MLKKFVFLTTLAVLLQSIPLISLETDSSRIIADISAENALLLDKLIEGNNRFASGNSIHPNISKERIALLSKKQTPFVVIVACSDSRVPPEIIFDQGLGDIFVVRTAGNVIGDYELGSIEYAVEHLKCSLVIVLGHENCGAISAYVNGNGHKHDNHIDSIVECIGSKPLVKALKESNQNDLSSVINANIKDDVIFLLNSKPVLSEFVKNNQIEVIGGIYNPSTGKVEFIREEK